MSAFTITINRTSHRFANDSGMESLKEEFAKVLGEDVDQIDEIEGDMSVDEIDAITDSGIIKIGTIKGALAL